MAATRISAEVQKHIIRVLYSPDPLSSWSVEGKSWYETTTHQDKGCSSHVPLGFRQQYEQVVSSLGMKQILPPSLISLNRQFMLPVENLKSCKIRMLLSRSVVLCTTVFIERKVICYQLEFRK